MLYDFAPPSKRELGFSCILHFGLAASCVIALRKEEKRIGKQARYRMGNTNLDRQIYVPIFVSG